MKPFLEVALYGAMAATTYVLILGVISLFRKDHNTPERTNRLMRLRVLFQAVALGVLALLMLMRKS